MALESHILAKPRLEHMMSGRVSRFTRTPDSAIQMEILTAFERAAALERLPFLLVSGVGRSGTTVTTKALGQHAGILSNGVESNVMYDVIAAAHAGCTMRSRKRQMVQTPEVYDAIFRRSLLSLVFDLADQPQDSIAAISTYAAMTADVADYALRLFPRMTMVYLLRNGIEVVSSRMQYESFKSDSFEHQCQVWNRSVRMLLWGKDKPRFFLLRHERLLEPDSLVAELHSLFERTGLEYDDQVVRYFLEFQSRRPGFSTGFPGESSQQQMRLTSRTERWNLWSEEQRATFRRLCGESMEAAGYTIPG